MKHKENPLYSVQLPQIPQIDATIALWFAQAEQGIAEDERVELNEQQQRHVDNAQLIENLVAQKKTKGKVAFNVKLPSTKK